LQDIAFNMVKNKYTTDPKSVDTYIATLDTDLGRLVNKVREVILSADPSVAEHVKWNAPSFFYTGDMADFDPKTYQRDIVVMNLRKGNVLLVFPTGDGIEDHSGLLFGNYTDGRRLAQVDSLSDLDAKRDQLIEAIRQWLNRIRL